MKKLVKAGLISDMTPYLKGMTYINKYKSATNALSDVIGKKGVWGMPSSLSSKAPTEPSEGLEPTFFRAKNRTSLSSLIRNTYPGNSVFNSLCHAP